MAAHSRQEAWLRGPVDGVAPLLQPVAHALIQAREDAESAVAAMAREDLWMSIGGAAPIGFHLRHAAGSLDRLFTYARGEALSDAQRDALAREKSPAPDVDRGELLAMLHGAIDRALAQLRATDPGMLVEPRPVGRARAPSTVIGLLFHAAEHTARHVGQVVTTARVVAGSRPPSAGLASAANVPPLAREKGPA